MLSKTILLISISIIILLIYYRFTLREHFYSRTETMVGKARRAKRHAKKNMEEFKNNISYKLKTALRKAHF